MILIFAFLWSDTSSSSCCHCFFVSLLVWPHLSLSLIFPYRLSMNVWFSTDWEILFLSPFGHVLTSTHNSKVFLRRRTRITHINWIVLKTRPLPPPGLTQKCDHAWQNQERRLLWRRQHKIQKLRERICTLTEQNNNLHYSAVYLNAVFTSNSI